MKLQGFVTNALERVRAAQLTDESDSKVLDLIFRTADGMPLRQRKVKRDFQRILSADLKLIRLYDLRHTAATLAVAAGVSVKVISEQLGHASISFTLERYSRVLPSIQDEAAAKVEQMLTGASSGRPVAEKQSNARTCLLGRCVADLIKASRLLRR